MKKRFIPAVFCILLLACTKINVFEKNVTIKNQTWYRNIKPNITFNIDDTTSLYNLYVILRHADAYEFNNIWIKCTVISPGDSTKKSMDYSLSLATNDRGWIGTGMDDIFEHRVLIQPQTKFNKTGEYQFVIEQIMREDPLLHILNIGVRIERMK